MIYRLLQHQHMHSSIDSFTQVPALYGIHAQCGSALHTNKTYYTDAYVYIRQDVRITGYTFIYVYIILNIIC
jgi:hypothetical protein